MDKLKLVEKLFEVQENFNDPNKNHYEIINSHSESLQYIGKNIFPKIHALKDKPVQPETTNLMIDCYTDLMNLYFGIHEKYSELYSENIEKANELGEYLLENENNW